MDELEYKTVKSMFSISEVKEVKQVAIDTNNMNFNEVSLQESTKIKKDEVINKNSNPLFNNPNQTQNNSNKKTKIRV
jgi:hypothetical protein